MKQETISFTVTRLGEAITFSLRMLSVFEEAQFGNRFADIADLKGLQKSDAEYSIYRDALADWSIEMPTIENGKKDKEGNSVSQPIGKGTPAEGVKEYFAEKTIGKEWVAMSAVNSFRNRLFPQVTFLPLSGS